MANSEARQTPFDKALKAIDEAHSLDPRSHTAHDLTVPYELHYAQKMTQYMNQLCSAPSEALQLAVRAQHFRRWEVPRDSYPMTKPGYFSWRNYLKKRQADLASEICQNSGLADDVVRRIAALIRKEGLREGDQEAQVLEDAACLVFLDEQLEEFEKGIENEEKIINILKKTWAKMGGKGKETALQMELGDRGKELVRKALEGN